MVSQCAGQQDSPVDPWRGLRDDACDVAGWSSLLHSHQLCGQSDAQLSKHKAAWINPGYVHQEGPDPPAPVPTVESKSSCIGGDTATLPLPHLGSTRTDSPVSKDVVNSVDSPLGVGMGEDHSESSLASVGEQPRLPPHNPKVPVPRILGPSPQPERGSARPKRPHPPASRVAGAAQVGRRTTSLSSFSLGAFLLPVDIEKENAHFYVADMIISTMEKIKYNILSEQQSENRTRKAGELLASDQADSEVTFSATIKQSSGSSSSDSGYEELERLPSAGDACGRPYSCSQSVVSARSFNSPERIAAELYRVFRKACVLAVVPDQLPAAPTTPASPVVNKGCVQTDPESSAEVGQEMKLKARATDTEDWLPPKFQIILKVHPPIKRDLALVAQDFLCAGCGTPIEPKTVKRLRYCEYLGKYFCHGCHTAAEACIPARILTSWDFRKYQVSQFSRRLLDSIWQEPVFNLLHVGLRLAGKVKELDRVKEIQEQLFHIKKLLRTCRFAESTLQVFQQLPSHLTDACHLFSLDDLVRVKKGLLVSSLKEVLRASLEHVARCELCQGKGFICEFCRSSAVIFPFQTATCRRCSVCRACFHRQCFQATQCPRCARNTARRKLLENAPTAAT